ncbi:hypothetical protein BJX66DRAFT_293103 [Aspergillus keveii]|uniref:Protein phosphatase 4 core regulatory subunit R2 n=1 Tax=Aspergillus keveii TaxID=714993 RepID=A0ABR4GKF3_9EURO
MALDEESLDIAANGGLMDLDKWPGMVEPLLERLENIIYNAFPMPEAPPEPTTPVRFQQQYLNPTSSFLHDPSSVPSSSNKENAAPPDLQTPPRLPPSSINPPSSTERVPESLPASQVGASTTALPAPLLLIYQSIQSTLRSLFSSKPPHTIQRLAELILRPDAHYKTLPAYLRAVDRVISVTSSADIFPLPLQTTAQPNGTINGAENTFILTDNSLGSDESLGGALLTPIPWLNNAASPGAETAGLDEVSITTTVPGLQQQLLTQPVDAATQEQQPTVAASEGAEGEMTTEPTEEIPHARGPSVLGVEDMGLQDGKGVEMTLLSTDAGTDNQPSSTGQSAVEQPSAQESSTGAGDSTLTTAAAVSGDDADGDGDITLSDEPIIPQEAEKQ